MNTLILHDSRRFGSGHISRAVSLRKVLKLLSVESQIIEMPSCSSRTCEGNCLRGIAKQNKPDILLIDSYRPKQCFAQFTNVKPQPRTLQLVDYPEQAVWAQFRLDPFSVLPTANNNFQGLEYAVSGLNLASRSRLSAESAEPCTLLIAPGSSVTPLHDMVHELAAVWNVVRFITPHEPLLELPSNVSWSGPIRQGDLFKLMARSQITLTNCGVTALQRLKLGIRGFSLVTEKNQLPAARTLLKCGANVIIDGNQIKNLLTPSAVPRVESAFATMIGADLETALKKFLFDV